MLTINKNGVNLTNEISNIFKGKTRKIKCKALITPEGSSAPVLFTDEQIVDMTIEEQIITSDKFSFGTANSSVLELTLNNVNDIYEAEAFIHSTVEIYFIVDTSKGEVDIPMGKFTLDTSTRNGNKLSLSGFDNVIFTEENYNLQTEMIYPTNFVKIVEEIEKLTGVDIDTNFFNNDYRIINGIVFNTDCTCRTILQNISEMCCGFTHADRTGKVVIKGLSNTIVDRITPENYFKFEYDKEFGPINSIYLSYGDGENAKDIMVGDSNGLQVQIRNNVYLQGDLEEIATKIYNKVNGTKYIPARLTYQGNPLIEVGDYIEVKDKYGQYKKLLVTYQKFTYNGSLKCEITSSGKSDLSIATDGKQIISESVEGLNNRVNQLTTWLDKTKLGFILEQIDNFSNRVDNLTNEVKKVQQSITPDGIVSTVTNSKTFKDVFDGINGALEGLGERTQTVESTITQHADKINMAVKADEILNYINLDTTGATIHADKISLEGVVTFDDLSGAGQTVINGSNITTGNIDANRVKFGEMEGVNITGSEFNVKANMNIIPPPLDTDGDGTDDLLPYEQHSTINFVNPADHSKLDSQLFVLKRKSDFPSFEYDPELYCNSNFGVNGEIQVGVAIEGASNVGSIVNPNYVQTPEVSTVNLSSTMGKIRSLDTSSIRNSNELNLLSIDSPSGIHVNTDGDLILSGYNDALLGAAGNLFIDGKNVLFNYGTEDISRLYYFGGTVSATSVYTNLLDVKEEFINVRKQHLYEKDTQISMGMNLSYCDNWNSASRDYANLYTKAGTVTINSYGTVDLPVNSYGLANNGYNIQITPINATESSKAYVAFKGATRCQVKGTPGLQVDYLITYYGI